MQRRVVRFGENLKIIRSRCKMTQAHLAEELCVERQTISAWENNLGKPDVYALAKICDLLDMKADEILFGKVPEPLRVPQGSNIHNFIEQEDHIRSINAKGFYDILEEDIQEFFNIIYIPFSRVMGIAMELKKYGYNIVDVYGNGFGIYFPTDEMAQKFSRDLYDIIDDGFMHHDESRIAVSYAEKSQARIDAIEIEILEEVRKELMGDDLSYYWIDEFDRIRGYGKTEEDCKKQAKGQECSEYTILKD